MCLFQAVSFFARKRNCKEYIFSNVQKKRDFPEVIPDIPVEIAGLDEQKQGTGEVDDKSDYEPKVRFLVDKYYLWLIHLVEEVKDTVRYDQDCFDGG